MSNRQSYLAKQDANKKNRMAAGLVADKYPDVEQMLIDMTYYQNLSNPVLMLRKVNVFPNTYAYFVMDCMIKECEGGAFDLGPVIKKMIKDRKKVLRGNMKCAGSENRKELGPDHASIDYEITITYMKAADAKAARKAAAQRAAEQRAVARAARKEGKSEEEVAAAVAAIASKLTPTGKVSPKAPARKAAPKRTPAPKPPVTKKAAPKPSEKKKSAPKKTTQKKKPSKKAPAKKKAAKKTPVKKKPAKKAPAKKKAAKNKR